MKLYLLNGEHFQNVMLSVKPFFSKAMADAEALKLVNILRADVAEYCDDDDDLELPPIPEGGDWRGALYQAQCDKAAHALGFPVEELETHGKTLESEVVRIAEFDVWIEEIEIAAPRIAVGVSGGAVQWVLADQPGVRVQIVDFDIDGHDPGEFDLTMVVDQGGVSEAASVWEETPDIQPDYFERLDAAPPCDVDGEIAGDDDDIPDDEKWLVSGEIGIPGSDGGIEQWSRLIAADDAEMANKKATAIVERRFGDGARIFGWSILPPAKGTAES